MRLMAPPFPADFLMCTYCLPLVANVLAGELSWVCVMRN